MHVYKKTGGSGSNNVQKGVLIIFLIIIPETDT
jgi:hypothetical protein